MSAPILSATDLRRHFEVKSGLFGGTNTVRALDGASFELVPGRTLAVVGESGCGKSTLANLVTMIDTPTSGTFTIDGQDIQPGDELKDKVLRAKVQIVFQNPYGSLNPRQTIGKILMEPLLLNRPEISAEERERRAREMVELVGLRPEHFNRYPHMFSGGQRQRIAVARALMLEPEILVLDEPVSALDLSIQSQVLNLLTDLQDKFNLAYLFISHDLSVVRHFADDVIVMYLGKPVEQGAKDEVFENPRHPYTKALLSATPMADPARRQERIKLEGELPSPLNVPVGCAFNPRCWKATEECRNKRPDMSDGSHRFACFHPENGDN
ncbi:dipeptide ABC transporter ATP-binding protein [Aliiroseovarius sp. KMU-50]|uniref:Dipeptide ABC transporter ATP-binding protein n=1 Tax=Aliiroseovarius salicola TaxID=3009082 RepID=A0ABT4VY31_9RHOB|nr:dipeptide ABC transporter ATP-binding protein [Aliiroseovarius sp. KMU-50]MDA5093157.1 dipeptide ABC transporter ATP-binding protein [Aliiroseovarius sp. KMU-50]